jgi:hypothetical protein
MLECDMSPAVFAGREFLGAQTSDLRVEGERGHLAAVAFLDFTSWSDCSVLRFRFLLPAFGLLLTGWFSYSYYATTRVSGTRAPGNVQHALLTRALPDVRSGTVQVRFVNALPGSPPMEFAENAAMMVSNVTFSAVSQYMVRAPGPRTLTLRHQAATTYDAVVQTHLLDGERYTVLAMCDSAGRAMLHVVLDELHPEPGRARVRVINAAAKAGDIAVRLRAADDVFLSAVHGTAVAAVRDVLPMTTGFSLRDRGDKTLATVSPMTLAAGVSYTIIAAARESDRVATIAIVDHAGELRDRPSLARE